MQAANRGQQVGAEGLLGAGAFLQRDQHFGEGLGDQVVGLLATHELARQPLRGDVVPGVEIAVRGRITGPHGVEQLGIAAFLAGQG